MHEHLKEIHPNCGNLRERKLRIPIDFFEDELRQIQEHDSSVSSYEDFIQPPALASPRYAGYSHKAEVRSSSERQFSATESSASLDQYSPIPQHTPQHNTSTPSPLRGGPFLDPEVGPGEHGIFDALSGSMMQPRKKKRKMTQKDIKDYRETRQNGACSKCKQGKAKVCGACTE